MFFLDSRQRLGRGVCLEHCGVRAVAERTPEATASRVACKQSSSFALVFVVRKFHVSFMRLGASESKGYFIIRFETGHLLIAAEFSAQRPLPILAPLLE